MNWATFWATFSQTHLVTLPVRVSSQNIFNFTTANAPASGSLR
jgi:hypothetical protein